MTKRAFDILCASAGLLLLSPVFVLIALLIKRDSRGPVFFRQVRVGLCGDPFRIVKFRTMVVDAESQGHAVTPGDDARITRIGRMLRRYKLDELPQLINVLAGKMSLVGPRPEVPRYVRLYSEEQKRVLTVRPGITGVSQLVFRDEEELLRGQSDVEAIYVSQILPAKLRLDLEYVQLRSLRGDLSLLMRTLGALLRRRAVLQSE